MAKQKKPDDHGERPKPDERGERPQKKGRERQVHEEIIARRLEGGAEPTPEAYARALKQWQQLPGSVVRPATDVTPPAQKPQKPKEPDGKLPPDDAGDEEHRS